MSFIDPDLDVLLHKGIIEDYVEDWVQVEGEWWPMDQCPVVGVSSNATIIVQGDRHEPPKK